MFVNYRTQGFILKKADRGEADQLFTIFTKDFGKLEVLGKAIRKISSKLRSGAEVFYLSEIEFIQGKTQKTLTDAILIEKFENIKKDLGKLKIAHKIAEVFDELIKGQEKDENLWQLLNEIFNKLNNQQLTINNQQLLYYYFFWNLLSILGYEPELYSCVVCQKKLVPGKLFFSAKEGGVICQKCFKELKLVKPPHQVWCEGKEITVETIKILRIILKKDWLLAPKLKIEKPNLKFLGAITNEYYLHIFNSYIRRDS